MELRGRRSSWCWPTRRFQLGGGRAFAVYVAGYTLGRTWIEMLRIDPANHIFGLRINVFTSVIVFLGAVLFLILRRHRGREDPAVVWGPDRPGKGEPAPSRHRAGDADGSADRTTDRDEPDPDPPTAAGRRIRATRNRSRHATVTCR